VQLVAMGSRYEAISQYHEKDVLKQAGFRWDPDRRRWWTADPLIAAKLRQYADATTRAQLDAIMAEREAAIAASRATSAEPLPSEVARAAHDAVRYLASLDRDYASVRNAAGFSKYDSALGHKLAELPHLTAGQARLARKLALRQLVEVLR
jgi:hypothetical protein